MMSIISRFLFSVLDIAHVCSFLMTSGRVRGGAVRRRRGVDSAGEVRGKWAVRRRRGVYSVEEIRVEYQR